MKVVNKHTLPRVDDHIFHVPIEEILPGDKLIIHDETLLDSSFWKVVTVPVGGVVISKSRNVLIEGKHTESFRMDWLPKFSYKYFLGLISFDSFETENFIGLFSQGEFEDDIIYHLLRPDEQSRIMVLKNVDKLKLFFNKN